MKKLSKRITAIVIASLIMAMSLSGCGGSGSNNMLSDNLDRVSDSFEDKAEEAKDDASDIDVDALKKSADKIKDLDLVSDSGSGDTDEDEYETDEDNAEVPEGDLTVYSYTDIYRNGNDITVIPNGGLNGNTELYGGKDLDGFLDYIDSEVLEEGRVINRDLFYDLLSISLIDKDLSSSVSYIETNMMVCLAVANNFYDTDLKINNCHLDNNNGAEYKYHVTAYGKDDIWRVNYQDRSFYMNDGKTEYHSTMFKDEYLSVWLVAIEEYYGITSTY